MKFDHPENSGCYSPVSVCGNGISAIFSSFFEPNWHPFYAERLAVFPRSVLVQDSQPCTSSAYWPDLATLTEDLEARQLAYYSTEPSSRSALLFFDKRTGGLHLRIYEDDRVLLGTLVSNAIDTEGTVAKTF
jgi:hypothetical protein